MMNTKLQDVIFLFFFLCFFHDLLFLFYISMRSKIVVEL
jgi:hypothetical protein